MTTIIVAIGENGEIGLKNELLWHLPNDLKHFKTLTSGHPIIMGRNTYESIGKALPNRTNIIVSQRKNWFQEGVLIVGSLKEALKFAKKIDEDIFIIGGGKVYEQTMDFADKLEVTLVKGTFEADTFFPKIDAKVWTLVNEEHFEKDEKHDFDYSFLTYERINKL